MLASTGIPMNMLVDLKAKCQERRGGGCLDMGLQTRRPIRRCVLLVGDTATLLAVLEGSGTCTHVLVSSRERSRRSAVRLLALSGFALGTGYRGFKRAWARSLLTFVCSGFVLFLLCFVSFHLLFFCYCWLVESLFLRGSEVQACSVLCPSQT